MSGLEFYNTDNEMCSVCFRFTRNSWNKYSILNSLADPFHSIAMLRGWEVQEQLRHFDHVGKSLTTMVWTVYYKRKTKINLYINWKHILSTTTLKYYYYTCFNAVAVLAQAKQTFWKCFILQYDYIFWCRHESRDLMVANTDLIVAWIWYPRLPKVKPDLTMWNSLPETT